MKYKINVNQDELIFIPEEGSKGKQGWDLFLLGRISTTCSHTIQVNSGKIEQLSVRLNDIELKLADYDKLRQNRKDG